MDPVRDAYLPLDVAGLALLVDQQADDRRAELLGEAEHSVAARALSVAVLEVGGVEHGPAAEPAQARLDHLGLGRVEHQRHRRLRREALRDLLHVGGAVATHVVDAHVDDVRALLHLVLGHRHAGVPVGLEHRLTELLGAVGVGALADHDEVRRAVGLVAVEDDGGVDRRDAVLEVDVALGQVDAVERVGELADVLRGGAAATADDRDAEVLDESDLVLDELLGGEVVVHRTVDHRGQPGVGQHGDGDA